MSENFMNSYEEITEIYKGFPLKADFLTKGKQALLACETEMIKAPELKDGRICFTMETCHYYDDESMLAMAQDQDYDVETAEEAWEALPEEAGLIYIVQATITVREQDGRLLIDDVAGEYDMLDYERKPFDEFPIEIEDVDEEYAFVVVEHFLDAIVDAD